MTIIKDFRLYLNAKYADTFKHKNGRYHQETRAYGDYLYHQDREQFDVLLEEALNGDEKFVDWAERPPVPDLDLKWVLLAYLQANTNQAVRSLGSRGEILDDAMVDLATRLDIGWYRDEAKVWQHDGTRAKNTRLAAANVPGTGWRES